MRKFLAAIIALGVLTALIGCARDDDGVSPVVVRRDLSSWALPIDPYRLPKVDLLAYASDLIRVECLKNKGIPDYPVIPYNENAPGLPTINSAGRRLFNLNIAKKFGYHTGHSQRVSERLMQERREPSAPGYLEAADKCEEEVVAAGIDWSQLTDDVAQKIIFSVGPNMDKVKKATEKWRFCMAAHPVPGQPDEPEKMPGDVLTQKFDLDKDPEWNSPPATSEEIAVAVQDAKCRESSGYSEALYNAEYEAQEKVVKEHASELAPLLERNKKVLEAARKIIKERG